MPLSVSLPFTVMRRSRRRRVCGVRQQQRRERRRDDFAQRGAGDARFIIPLLCFYFCDATRQILFRHYARAGAACRALMPLAFQLRARLIFRCRYVICVFRFLFVFDADAASRQTHNVRRRFCLHPSTGVARRPHRRCHRECSPRRRRASMKPTTAIAGTSPAPA